MLDLTMNRDSVVRWLGPAIKPQGDVPIQYGGLIASLVLSVSQYAMGNIWLGHVLLTLALVTYVVQTAAVASRWALVFYGLSCGVVGIGLTLSLGWLIAVVGVVFMILLVDYGYRQSRSNSRENVG